MVALIKSYGSNKALSIKNSFHFQVAYNVINIREKHILKQCIIRMNAIITQKQAHIKFNIGNNIVSKFLSSSSLYDILSI